MTGPRNRGGSAANPRAGCFMAQGSRVLIIDDDQGIRTLLYRALADAGYLARESEPGQAALRHIGDQGFDLLILDIDSRISDDADVLHTARGLSSAPILALSSRNDKEAAANALDRGADDYVKKPFGVQELLARVRNALRWKARVCGKFTHIVTEEFEIDLLHGRVRSRGQEVYLPVKSYEVLRVLAERAGNLLAYNEIIHAVWGDDSIDRQAYLRVAVRRLRRELEPDPAHPRYILTETGVGYRLVLQSRPAHKIRVKVNKPPEDIPDK
jgi:two-component system, OmpR family, KDP operon response regulator KdpE